MGNQRTMKYQRLLFAIIAFTSLFSCKNVTTKIEKEENIVVKEEIQDSTFCKLKKLSEFKNTQFIPTLEHVISYDKNSVYCATFLFAWNEIRKQINSPLTIPDKYADLKLLNQSTSFFNVLKNDEYDVKVEMEGFKIKAKAEFNKSLPFELKLQSFKNKLSFDGQKVASFGVTGKDEPEQLKIVQIVYYKNNNNFIIKLLPKEKDHEIILFKTDQKFTTMAEMSSEIEKLTIIGKKERKNQKMSWKYKFNEEDLVVIPKFNFNIETHYSTLEGNNFSSETDNYLVEKAWQRTAFILDESGAKVESEAFVVVDLIYIEENEKPKPKKMIFDKPFLILLKRTDAKNPYFGLWITNTELMIKE